MRPELLKYHPNRYYNSRPFFRPLYNMLRPNADAGDIFRASDMMRLNSRFIVEHWNPELERLPLEQRPLDMGRLMEEESMFAHVVRFTFAGRNIFHLSPTLISLLRLTDAEDVLWDSIRLPYSAFYLWFGQQQDWAFEGGRYLPDGAYVADIPGHGTEFFVTTCRKDADYVHPASYVTERDFYYYVPFKITDRNKTVGDSLGETVETDDAFRRTFDLPHPDSTTKRAAEKAGVTLVERTREDSAQYQVVEERLRNLPVFRQVLKLLINGLCYLASPSREVVTRYPEEVQVKDPPTGREAKRHNQALRREGYTEIHFCGESLERESIGSPTGREMQAHWRRGHWRNQAWGTHHSQHKLLWIRPTLVRKDRTVEGETVGHVYKVSAE